MSWLNIFDVDRKISYPDIVDESQKEVVLFTYDNTKSKKLGTYWDDNETPILLTINKASKTVKSTVSYTAPFQGEENGEPIKSIMWSTFNLSGTQVGMVKKVTGKKRKNQTYEMWLMEMLGSGKWGKKKKIWDGTKHTKSPFKVISPDKSLVVLGAFENSIFNYVITDGDLSDFVTNKIDFNIKYSLAEALGITNDGKLAFVLHTKSGIKLRKYDIFTKKHEDVDLCGSLGNDESYDTEYKIDDGQILYSTTINGTYEKKNKSYVSGLKKVLTYKVDLETMKVTNKSSINLNDEDLLMKFYKEKSVVKGKRTELSTRYNLINVDESNKNIFTLLEYRYDYTTTSCDDKGNCTTTYHYERNNLLLITVSKMTGKVTRTKIPKLQHQKNSYSYGGSNGFADSQGYNIIFRDTEKNLGIKEGGKPKSSNKPKKEPLTVIRYNDKTQTTKRKILVEPKGLVSKPKIEYSENGKIWLYCFGHNSFSFGEYNPQ